MADPLPLPDSPSLEWLRKEAKRHLVELRKSRPETRLAEAQFDLAKRYGFPSWRALKTHVDGLTIDGRLFQAARSGDLNVLGALLDRHPGKLSVRSAPYGWTLLHAAAHAGQPAAVNLLLERGLDPNTREQGDNTYAMHWAAAAGHLDVVRRLAEAGGDVVGRGDDHEGEVIGWATCWDGCDDDAHRAIVDFLISRGARHHIFSAIAMNQADQVRRIVAADSSALERTMSRNEGYQRPLHFAVRMKRSEMITLLLDLGADPLGRDGSGYGAWVYATSPEIDRPVMEAIRRGGKIDLFAAVALGDWEAAGRLAREHPGPGPLHLMAKRGDARGVKWLLEHGADPNARWAHWDAEVTALHLCAFSGNPEVVELLLAAGADPGIRDSKHDGDARGWAEQFGRLAMVHLLNRR